MEKVILVDADSRVRFHNQVDYCIGTGRMGLALTKEYQEQLKLVQDYIGFSHIRGHGLFCDDMAIYQETEDGEAEYNYTYLDRVIDSYRAVGLAPFLELGFMPEKLARGTQTVFYWKGNVTPPKDYARWTDMVKTLLVHLCERYGKEEVLTWPIEVWNEPNLCGFWENADMQEYFKLFHETFLAVKSVDGRFRVGGPAVCGGTDEVWIAAFMEYCHTHQLAIDFVTRHHYTTDFPEPVGHYGYVNLSDPEHGFANLHTTREIIDRYPEYRGLQIHITEFNTSYIPNCPTHDTNQNAAYIAHQLSRLGDDNETYSYWTFGDVFEEQGVPFTPFHGGFGLVANGCIPKPTFWTFVFYKKLKQKGCDCVYRDDDCVIMKKADGTYCGIVWNSSRERTGRQLHITAKLPCGDGRFCLLTRTVDEKVCNPLKVWHDMGEHASLTEEELALLKEAAVPQLTTWEEMAEDGVVTLEMMIREFGVVYFECSRAGLRADRGYEYDRAIRRKLV